MALVRFGVDPRSDQLVRRKGGADRVDFVVARSTFLAWPRGTGLRTIVANTAKAHPGATFIPYAWHYLTHESSDGMAKLAARTLPGSPHGFGHLRETPEVESAWASIFGAMESAGVTALILKTPPSFSPSSANQQRLATFVKKMSDQGISAIWQPEGLWTSERAAQVADELNIPMITTCMGASGRVVLPTQVRWLRVDGEVPARHADALAYDLAETIEANGLVNGLPPVVIFGGDAAYGNLRSFVRACEAYGLLEDSGHEDEDDDDEFDENDDLGDEDDDDDDD
jgi:hypothetical protein